MTQHIDRREEHPEALLDLLRATKLRATEWEILRRHLVTCAACATEARLSSRPFLESEAHTWDDQGSRLADAEVLDRWRRTRRPWRLSHAPGKLIPVGMGALLLSGTALAATWWSSHREAQLASRPEAGSARQAVSSSHRPDPVPRPLPFPTAPLAEAPLNEGAADVPSRARDLFERARLMRLAGNTTGALAIYQQLQRSYLDTDETRLSYLMSGRIFLAQHRPDLAASQFAHYLQTGGTAVEEALVGHANAAAQLGRYAAEGADWKTLLSRHPNSLYAHTARTRLDELSHLKVEGEAGTKRP